MSNRLRFLTPSRPWALSGLGTAIGRAARCVASVSVDYETAARASRWPWQPLQRH